MTGWFTFLRPSLSDDASDIVPEYYPDALSPTPFGLSLGPTNPELTNIALGILRFSVGKILTSLIATHSSILTY